eukprot:scaffold215519_cov53-Attheya_sp.AAC.1
MLGFVNDHVSFFFWSMQQTPMRLVQHVTAAAAAAAAAGLDYCATVIHDGSYETDSQVLLREPANYGEEGHLFSVGTQQYHILREKGQLFCIDGGLLVLWIWPKFEATDDTGT